MYIASLCTLILLIFITHQQGTWVTYKQFVGYIPSYTYPIQLNSGDTVRGLLSWPGTQDLDIYLYNFTSDILSRVDYMDRQFSGILNPEELVYTVTNSGMFYLRVDLFSTIPTAYKFEIFVNDVLIQTFYDTVITVQAGQTAQQFSVDGPCQVRVKYDGPICVLGIFQPGVDVIEGTPVAYDNTNTNPKYITQYLSTSGLWNLVVYHGLFTSHTLTPFKIIVETLMGAGQCLNFCSDKPYTLSLIPGYQADCLCQTGFYWDFQSKVCVVDCATLNINGDLGLLVAETYDQCQCLTASKVWNTTQLACVIDCSQVLNAIGSLNSTDCLCSTGFYMEKIQSACVRNCSGISNNAGISTNNVSICNCVANYNWNTSTNSCEANLICGDNFVAGTEQCDDGNNVDGDGCNADCTTGNNNSCPAATPYRDPVTTLCTATCPAGYYTNTTLFSCPTCLFSCATCTNATDCVTCNPLANRYLNGTQCLPNSGFFENNTNTAPACISPCVTCTSSSACLTCVVGYYISGTTCVACSTITNCNRCSSSTTCTLCQSGFVANATTGVCDVVPCTVANCVSCPVSMSVCDGCALGFQLISGACNTVCGDTIIAGTEQCDDGNNVDGDGCNADCTTGNNNSCPAATPYRDPVTTLCTATCPAGYYTNTTLFSCPTCLFSCATCTNATDCVTCNPLANRYLNGTQCLPNSGFFENNTNTAPACISPCVTCTSSSACLTCVVGYYISGTTCVACSTITNCNRCSSSTTCTLCQSGFVANATTGVCDVVPCTVANCISCPVSMSVCDGCALGFQLISGACNTVCGDTIIAGTEQCDDGNNVDGDGCNADCTTGNNNSCPAATPYRDPVTTLCTATCPAGYYTNTTLFSCPTCLFSCATCTNATDCVTCNPLANRYLNGTQCLPNSGFFENNTNTAPACISPCVTCTSSSACLTCVVGYYISGTTCVACSTITNCNRCSSSTTCTLCQSGFVANATTGVCDVVPCTVANCVSCPVSMSVCDGCALGFQLISGACNTVCGDTIIAGTEQCDDGNNVDGDGCNADCTTGNNNSCPAATPYRDPVTTLCTATCPAGYYTNTTLFSCPTCLFSCATCTNATDCVTCNPLANRYLNGTQCLPNSGFFENNTNTAPACISPCVTCTSSSACLTCVVGYYISGTTCVACSTITNCNRCSSSTTCTLCQSGFVANATTGVCDVVPCTVANCVSCPVSMSVCDGCALGFQLISGACNTVCGDTIIAGTEQCDDGNNFDGDGCNADCTTGNNNSCPASSPYINPITTACTSSCPNGFYADSSTFTCAACHFSCATCTNATDCVTCDPTSNRFLNGTQCVPNSGFYENNTHNASICTSPCVTCISASACLTCVAGFFHSGTTCTACSTITPFCSTCDTAGTACTFCDLGYVLNTTTNVCDVVPCNDINCLSCPNSMAYCLQCTTGFSAISGNCQTICGDFVIAGGEACDDGNSGDNDGCSSTCTVETNFTCEPDPVATAGSACYYIGTIEFKEVYINKVDGENKIEIKLDLFPSNLSIWDQVNFLEMIQVQSPVPITGYDVVRNADGTVSITVSYGASIQGQPMDIKIDPTKTNLRALSRATPSTTNLVIEPDDNEAAYFYDPSVYSMAAVLKTVCIGISAVAAVFVVIGIFSGKMIGVEMMAVIQISFFSLLTISHMNPCFAALSSLKLVNGYNSLTGDPLADQLTPNQPKGIFLFSRFTENFNFTAAIVLIPLLVGLVAFILYKTAFKDSERTLLVAKRAVGEYTLMGLLLGGYMIAVAFALQMMYGMKKMDDFIGTVSLAECAVLLLMLVGYFVFLLLKPDFFGEFSDSFKKDRVSSKQYNFFIVERVLVGSCLVFLLSTGFAAGVPLAVFVAMGVMVLCRKPYKEDYHNRRVVANMTIAVSVEAVFLAYTMVPEQQRNSQPIFLYLPFIVCGLLVICLILNCLVMVYDITKYFRNKNLIQNLEKQEAEQIKKFRQQAFGSPKANEQTKLSMSTSLTLSPQNSVKLNTIRKKINVKDLKNEIKKISSTETKKDVSNSYAVFDNPSNMKAELIEDYDAI